MIAHFEDGTSQKISPRAATIGLRVVRWEFDFNDMRELLANPELLPILFTRMPPTSPQREWQGLTDEEIKKEQHHIDWTNAHTYAKFARAIEAKLKEKNSGG